MLGALEDALELEDARHGSTAQLFYDQLGYVSARLRADASFAHGCLTLPGLTRLTIAEHGLRYHVQQLWIHLTPTVWTDECVLLAASALYAPEVFPLLWPTDRIRAYVKSPEPPEQRRATWFDPFGRQEWFEHCCVHGDAAIVEAGAHMQASMRWHELMEKLREHFEPGSPMVGRSSYHGSWGTVLGLVQSSGEGYTWHHDVPNALLSSGLDVPGTSSFLHSTLLRPPPLHNSLLAASRSFLPLRARYLRHYCPARERSLG